MPQQRKFFPGWLVVASGFVIMATCWARSPLSLPRRCLLA